MSTKLRRELRIDILALILFIAILVVDKTGLLPVVFEHKWISLLVYLVPYFLVGLDVVKDAALGIKNRRPMDESFLMTLATIGAFITGENSEAVAVMLFYQIGEWFQSYAVGRSRRSITELMDIVPEYANLELEDGSLETIDADEVEPGSILVIRAGERIPVDAEVLSGESLIDTAALTGESVPRSVHAGDEVISGCVNGDGLLRVRALKAFEDSTVSKVLEMVEEASEKKSHTENFITRFARYYTPIVVAAAVILAIVPSLFTGAWSTWIYRAILSLRTGHLRASRLLRRDRRCQLSGRTGEGIQLSGTDGPSGHRRIRQDRYPHHGELLRVGDPSGGRCGRTAASRRCGSGGSHEYSSHRRFHPSPAGGRRDLRFRSSGA